MLKERAMGLVEKAFLNYEFVKDNVDRDAYIEDLGAFISLGEMTPLLIDTFERMGVFDREDKKELIKELILSDNIDKMLILKLVESL